MHPDSILAPVIAPVTIECEFWPDGDGWAGSNEPLQLVVRGNNFEEAKKHMQAALAEKLLSFLDRPQRAQAG
jgi:hypothetical protein